MNTTNSLNTINSLNTLNTTNSLNTFDSINNYINISNNIDFEIPEYSNSVLEERIENTDYIEQLYGFFNDIKISSYNPTSNDFIQFMKNENKKYFCIRSRKMLYKSPRHGIIGIDRGHVFNENPDYMTFGHVNYINYYDLHNN